MKLICHLPSMLESARAVCAFMKWETKAVLAAADGANLLIKLACCCHRMSGPLACHLATFARPSARLSFLLSFFFLSGRSARGRHRHDVVVVAAAAAAEST